jgi:hypothetical protein
MGRTIKMAKVDPGITVEVGTPDDTVEFKMKPITQEVEDDLDDCSREIQRVMENPDSTPRDRCESIVAQLDAMLEPLPRPGGDVVGEHQKRQPSEILMTAYDSQKITRAQVNDLVDKLVAAGRPT